MKVEDEEEDEAGVPLFFLQSPIACTELHSWKARFMGSLASGGFKVADFGLGFSRFNIEPMICRKLKLYF